MTKKTITAAALALSRQDRAELIERLNQSLDDEPIDPSIQEAWLEVAEQRHQDYLQGKRKIIPAEESHLASMRKLQ